jgi:hypothetical protein
MVVGRTKRQRQIPITRARASISFHPDFILVAFTFAAVATLACTFLLPASTIDLHLTKMCPAADWDQAAPSVGLLIVRATQVLIE